MGFLPETMSDPPGVALGEPAAEAAERDELARRLAGEMAQRWREGRPLAEEFLARHPVLRDDARAGAQLVAEEVRLRRAYGAEVARADLLRRFPAWREPLEEVLDALGVAAPGAEPLLPEVGESLGDFRLVAELGRGGQGCVFLATQPSLADRPVVIKVTARDGAEHLSLARLQHTYVVPLYAVHDDPARNLRALCMPYFGNATLKHLVDAVQKVSPERRTGQHLLDALDRMQEGMPLRLPARGPGRQVLARASYVQALCWIGACQAEALHYAHERGLVHLDIKPSNVLLALDGQPMLLDFHLAQKPIDPAGPPPEWIGGSALYMSPEHKAAVAAVRANRPIPRAVDGRADIYSLGALLYGALGGALPFKPESSPPLHCCNPLVSVGLSDIIGKCLAPDPAERYARASMLAGDVQRHLAHRPLVGVANRSPAERLSKFRRRRPYALPVTGLLLAVAIAGGALIALRQAATGQQRRQVEVVREAGREQLERGRFDEAASTLQYGLTLAESLPEAPRLAQEFHTLLLQAERGQTRRELTALAGRLRFLYGADFLSRKETEELAARCRLFWDNRAQILERLGAGRTLAPDPSPLQAELLDLALLWSDLRVRLAPKGNDGPARREALQVLDQAETLFGPSAVVAYQRQMHAQALGEAEAGGRLSGNMSPRNAWEHYALGRAFLQSGDLEGANRGLTAALVLEPHAFWPNFFHGVCAYRRGQFTEAVAAFSVCVGSDPANAGCFYNRALAYTAMGHADRAMADYGYALRLDPALAPAYLNRGLLHYRDRHYAEAKDDLQQALGAGADPAAVYYNLALVYWAERDRPRALENLQQALAHQPDHADARRLRETLLGNSAGAK